MKSNSSISYKGNVTIKILHKDRVVKTIKNHNEGTNLLMSFLVHCLGSDYDKTKAPKYIMAYNLSGEAMEGVNNPENNVTIKPIATNISPTYTDNSVTLSFLLPSTILDVTKKINRLAIYSSSDLNPINYMAWIKVDPEINLSMGESLLVLWEMTLQNIPEDSNN